MHVMEYVLGVRLVILPKERFYYIFELFSSYSNFDLYSACLTFVCFCALVFWCIFVSINQFVQLLYLLLVYLYLLLLEVLLIGILLFYFTIF